MISRRDLLCAGALAPLSTYSFAAPAYKAGKEYLTVHPMAPTPAAARARALSRASSRLRTVQK